MKRIKTTLEEFLSESTEGRIRGGEGYKKAEWYDYTLEGSDATEENAEDAARGLDWSEIDKTEQDLKYMTYKNTINGIEIYYCYGSDSYSFKDAD